MTYCGKDYQGPFTAIIQLENVSVLGASAIPYLRFRVPLEGDPTVGTEYTISGQIGADSGIEVWDKGISTNLPTTVLDYHTNALHTCKVTFTEFIKGRKAAGNIACTLKKGTLADNDKLGARVTISRSEWVCDRWGFGANTVTIK